MWWNAKKLSALVVPAFFRNETRDDDLRNLLSLISQGYFRTKAGEVK